MKQIELRQVPSIMKGKAVNVDVFFDLIDCNCSELEEQNKELMEFVQFMKVRAELAYDFKTSVRNNVILEQTEKLINKYGG